MKWTFIKDERPPVGETVLLVERKFGTVIMGTMKEDKTFTFDSKYKYWGQGDIIAWMPKPKLSKDLLRQIA